MENVRKHGDVRLLTKLFSIKVKLSYYKDFHRKFINNRNKKNRDTYE